MQLCNLCKSITNTISKNKEQVIFLNTGDILDGKILNFKYSKVSSLPGQAKKTIKNNDILFSEIRPKNGRYALVNVENPDDFVVSTKLMVIRCDDIVLPKYLYYYLTSPKIISHLQELAESRSGTFPQITFDEIKSLNIDLPSKDFQQHIVNIIGSIDDLIEHKNLIINKINQLKKYLYFKSIAKSQAESTLKKYINIETGSMNLNENDPNGEYIFYTRNEGTFKANKYTHNQTGVIVAGEGNFTPKYAKGKFGLHQRAYLLSSNSDLLSDEILLQIVSSNVDYLNSVAVGSTVKSLRRNSFENMPFYIDGKYDEIKNVLFKLQKLENEYIHLINKLNNTKQIYLKKFFG